TGEVMAIDRTFEAALQKAVRSLEIGNKPLLWEDPKWELSPTASAEDALAKLPLHPNDMRLWALMAALRRGVPPLDLCRITGVDPWFMDKLAGLAAMERRLLSEPLTPALLWEAKRNGFGDEQVAVLSDHLPEKVRELRRQLGIIPVYKMVDTCAAEFAAQTPYYYSTYEQENEATPLLGNRAVVIGSGPIRIGQGIEFDYASVHSAWALQEAGYAGIMINSNPETVSTDFDTSQRLYFEPLDEESVRDILENEAMGSGYDDEGGVAGEPPACIVQFGGQTAINLAAPLTRAGMPILGSSAEAIDLAEDRKRFEDLMNRLGIPQPPGGTVTEVEAAMNVAQAIGYPVLIRPSYVLGGRAMEIVHGPGELVGFMSLAVEAGGGKPVLIDKYLQGKEVEVDAICDGERVLIPGVMEHIERAGVHSGDSMAVYPGLNLSEDEVQTLVEYTIRIGLALNVRGLMNVQYVIMPDPQRDGASSVYVLEVNPRASRTVPFLSKVTGVPMVRLATRIMLGQSLEMQGYEGGLWPRQRLVAIKAPVFSMSKLVGVDTYLGPEMKSTGEVMGIDEHFPGALTKALMASGLGLPSGGGVLLSIADRDKPEALPIIRMFVAAGYRLYATEGTAATLTAVGLPVTLITKKLREGHPNVVDVIADGTVHAVINTVTGDRAPLRDGFDIRRAAAEHRIPCFTSLDTARAAISSLVNGATYNVRPLPEYRVRR
ncbi:MAG: carbamoyl-phosphate synthase large subunit, partial [Chloroflexi bacterium]|nr:carbamoyl-phosphate synthase large subunit [Chloroflexota bacterium]